MTGLYPVYNLGSYFVAYIYERRPYSPLYGFLYIFVAWYGVLGNAANAAVLGLSRACEIFAPSYAHFLFAFFRVLVSVGGDAYSFQFVRHSGFSHYMTKRVFNVSHVLVIDALPDIEVKA